MPQTPRGPRPGAVTAAAVLAFVVGGLLIFLHLWTVLAVVAYTRGGVAGADAGSFAGVYAVLAFRIAAGALYICGALAALRGRTRTILLIASVLQVILAVFEAVTNVVGLHGPNTMALAGTAFAVLDLILAVPVLALILQPSATRFFRAGRSSSS